jgi:hypothetical protein
MRVDLPKPCTLDYAFNEYVMYPYYLTKSSLMEEKEKLGVYQVLIIRLLRIFLQDKALI